MKTVLLDMDSIVVNLQAAWYAEYNRRSGDDLHEAKVVEWDTGKFARDPKTLWQVLGEPGFFQSPLPLPGALDGVRALLDEGHDVVIASACTRYAFTDKMLWLEQHMPWFDQKRVMLGYQKHRLKGDVLFDDGPHNLEAYAEAWPQAKLATIAYPYNRGARTLCHFVAGEYTDTAAAWRRFVEWIRWLDAPTF